MRWSWLPLLCVPLWAETVHQPEYHSGFFPKELVYAEKMMVVTANPYASEAGLEMLRRGGNAIDAAIAIQMVLNVVEPQSSGIGGGGFMLYYNKKTNEVVAYDGRETAPQAVDDRLFLDAEGKALSHDDAIVGGTSVGVPGVLKMLEIVHQEMGKLPWATLFEPAITLARDGFPISHRLAKLVTQTPALESFPESRSFFAHPQEGELLKNPELAETLTIIAEQGTKPFYEGEIGADIVHTVQTAPRHPGSLSMADLAEYRAIKRVPIKSTYKDYTVYGFPPPSGGGLGVAQILAMLEQHDFTHSDLGSLETVELFCKASALAFADRNFYLADPAFFPVPVKRLLNPFYLKKRGQMLASIFYSIRPGLWAIGCCPHLVQVPSIELPATSHFNVVDKEGNVLAMTTSVENAFGSTLMVRGFFLNNQITDFSFLPVKKRQKAANRVEPGKRPMSSMSPTLVFRDGKFVLCTGSAGGPRIIDYVAQTVFGVLEFSMNIQDAISFPHYAALNKIIDLEQETFLEVYKPLLQERGHEVRIIFMPSGTQGIEVAGDYLIGGVDPRREGLALGE